MVGIWSGYSGRVPWLPVLKGTSAGQKRGTGERSPVPPVAADAHVRAAHLQLAADHAGDCGADPGSEAVGSPWQRMSAAGGRGSADTTEAGEVKRLYRNRTHCVILIERSAMDWGIRKLQDLSSTDVRLLL